MHDQAWDRSRAAITPTSGVQHEPERFDRCELDGVDTQDLCTHNPCMAQNLTIAVDEELLRRARALAHKQGTSVNALLRKHLETLVGEQPGDLVADELLMLMLQHGGRSGGRKILRDELYEDRIG